MNDVELLAPAGTYAGLQAAINSGCDAVYFGLDGFNMRANTAAAFGLEDLAKISSTCHGAGIKCYLALNTLVYDDGIEGMKAAIDAAKENDIDAIITFDMSAIRYAREIGVEVHISTQHSISNIEAVKFFAQWADRVVLARELTLEQIKTIIEEIQKQDVRGPKGELVEIEIFIHGAMCVSVSGRCGMSLYMYGTSANCGKCSQPCRRAYTVIDKATGRKMDIENEYVMSTEDLCTIGMLDEIIATGAASLKIEGRGRAPEYASEVVSCYREAIESIEADSYTKEKIEVWNKRLGTVFNRGLSEGFYRGKAFEHWAGIANSKATTKKTLVGTVLKYYPKISVAEVRVHASEVDKDQDCIFIGASTGVMKHKLVEMLLDGTPIDRAEQEQVITFKVESRVRKNDKFYKIETTE